MQPLHNHLVLIGFKHTGKSSIGSNLAKKLHVPFIDLDRAIEIMYENKFGEKLTCRMIMQKKGVEFFRLLETNTLIQVINAKPSIISLGGGTPLSSENQRIIQPHILIHITAPKGIVYERIVVSGRPAFIKVEEDLFEGFNRLWNERMKVYRKIEDFSVSNDSSIQDSVDKITEKLASVSDIDLKV